MAEAFPAFFFLVTTEGARRFSDFYLVPIQIDWENRGDLMDRPGTITNEFLYELSRVLAPYVGGDDRVSVIVKTGEPSESDDGQPPPTRH